MNYFTKNKNMIKLIFHFILSPKNKMKKVEFIEINISRKYTI